MILIALHSPESREIIMEWPVARVQELLAQFPEPIERSIETQEDQEVELLLTRMTKRVAEAGDASKVFKKDHMSVDWPLCVYEPDKIEDHVAQAFGYSDFSSVPLNRIVDVCHVASHRRFAVAGDIFLAEDSHFSKRKLAEIGVDCLSVTEFMVQVDPCNEVLPVNLPSA